MEKAIAVDCLLIGHNEMDFREYEKSIRNMGMNSGAYRDLDLNFIIYNNRPYTLSEMFNIFYYQHHENNTDAEPFFHVAESFSVAIAYLGTYLDRNGYTFDYVNDFQYSKTRLAEKLQKGNILVTAIVTTLYVSVLPIIEIIEFIKNYNRTTKIVVGGPFVSTKARTLSPEELEYLFQTTIGADFYVNSSQGETALIKIINAIKNNLSLEEVPNIYYKVGDTFKATQVLRENNRLSGNMVNWNLFKDSVHRYANIRTSISCLFSCSFCGFPRHAGQYQVAPVEAIGTELEKLARIGTVESVHFIDDTFNIPVERFKEILRMIVKNKFAFKWHSYFRCQFADREMVELMKMSGCEGVFLGLESGNDQILENMNKAVEVEKYLRGIELLKEYGIVTFGNFIIGFPGETEETVKETVNFIETGGLDFYRAQLWYCEPITPIFKKKDHYQIKGESFEWSHATMNAQKACDLIENIFLKIENPTWIPQYNFDFDSVWHLVHRGMSIPHVRNLLKCFNLAVKEKLIASSRREVSYEALKQLKNACSNSKNNKSEICDADENTFINPGEADFEF
ncbi:MAG: PhpK family radical SAM P-methyltransferase [Candidatus Aminicenantes bacterium]|jgi:radical SAM PhpK family P-methyltransferase